MNYRKSDLVATEEFTKLRIKQQAKQEHVNN